MYDSSQLCLVTAQPTTEPAAVPAVQRVERTQEPRYALVRWVFLRLLGVVYLAAFASLLPQIRGLIGQNGILPAAAYLGYLGDQLGTERYWLLPTLAWIDSSDSFLLFLCGGGVLLALLVIADVLPGPALALLWAFYLSLMNIGQDFLSFQWDALLLETGFLAIFFAPWKLRPGLAHETPPSRMMLWLLRWLLFRLMFFSGVVKLASGDPTWQGLTALNFHYETQPLPTPLAWYVHLLPAPFHAFSVAMVFVIELSTPFLILAPRRFRFAGAALMISLQLLIMFTGNYAFFNTLTIALCLLLLDDAALRRLLPAGLRARLASHVPGRPVPGLRRLLVVAVAGLVFLLSIVGLQGAVLRNATLPRPLLQLAGTLDSLHLVNSYGLFAVMTTSRPEIIIEGSNDGTTWQEYAFAYKPGDVRRALPWVAPYHPRLDWQMWFAALSPARGNPWFAALMQRLAEGTPEVLALLQHNPFPQAPPRYLRALLYDYHFTDPAARARTDAWWRRDLQGVYYPPAPLNGP